MHPGIGLEQKVVGIVMAAGQDATTWVMKVTEVYMWRR